MKFKESLDEDMGGVNLYSYTAGIPKTELVTLPKYKKKKNKANSGMNTKSPKAVKMKLKEAFHNTDPTKEEMLNALSHYKAEDGFEDSAEVAIYWFATHYHGGQNSNLYKALSKSAYKPGPMSKGPEKGSLEEMMLEDLIKEFGT